MHQNCGYINKCVSGHVHEIGDLAARHHLDASKVAMEHDLVGGPGPPRPEKMMDFVNWDDDIPNSHGKIQKMATKPPTSDVSPMICRVLLKSVAPEAFCGRIRPI